MNPNVRLERRAAILAVAACLVSGGTLAQPRELALYGVPLKNAEVRRLIDAALRAGVKPAGKTGSGLPHYDARAAGVPALGSFTLLADAGEVVTIQFSVVDDRAADEKLRRMLVQKYGQPVATDGLASRFGTGLAFDDKYLQGGTYVWEFAEGMKLVFKKRWGGPSTLSYTDAIRFKLLLERAEQAARRGAAAKAGELSDKF